MSTIAERFLRDQEGKKLKEKVRKAMIELLSWNDKNGTFRDSDNETPMDLTLLVECAINQDLIKLPECEIQKDGDCYEIYVNGYYIDDINENSHPELYNDIKIREKEDV